MGQSSQFRKLEPGENFQKLKRHNYCLNWFNFFHYSNCMCFVIIFEYKIGNIISENVKLSESKKYILIFEETEKCTILNAMNPKAISIYAF